MRYLLISLCKKTPNTALYSFLKQSYAQGVLLGFKNFASPALPAGRLVFDDFLSKTVKKVVLLLTLMNIFVLVIISSCSPAVTAGLIQQPPKKEYVINDFFSNSERDYVYKARLQILKHHFGGILIIKKMGEEHYRVVFTTEFGNKLFDLEFIADDFRVNYMMDELNKKFILNMLQHDFQTLLTQNNRVDHQFSNEIEYIFQSNREEYQNYYVFSKQTNELTKIVSASKNKEKLIISFIVTEKGISTSINLSHKKFKTNMDLNYIGK